MNVEQLYKSLKASQGKKGYYFNKNKDLVFELLEALILNKERYGYMACPCRLACGEREKDKDIICPCEYRAADLEEFEACYCGLYVSETIDNKEMVSQSIPERRPPEKIF
ncbi:MAG: ferredoxin:thioredoxin reductase [Desulfobacteraceae bacterium]|nr:ferredoxin:thioredoxin reductase [Desulfobacteraceae bacterium]